MSQEFTALTNLPGKLDENLAPERSALLVIDMQRYFVHPDYALGRALHQIVPDDSEAYYERVRNLVIPNIQRLLATFRGAKATVVFTEFGSNREDGRDFPGWARKMNAFSQDLVGQPMYPPFEDPSCRVDESLAPQPGEMVLQKTTSGPCNSTKLDQMLRVLQIDSVVVTGVATDICVAQTAREFGDRDFRVVVAEDACANFDMRCHEATLDTIARVFGSVTSTGEVLKLLTI